MNDGLLWFVGSLLLAVAVVCIAGNLSILLGHLLRGKHNSMVPFIGGLAGVIGMLVVPITVFRRWSWIPVILDIGTLPIAVAFAFVFMRRRKNVRS